MATRQKYFEQLFNFFPAGYDRQGYAYGPSRRAYHSLQDVEYILDVNEAHDCNEPDVKLLRRFLKEYAAKGFSLTRVAPGLKDPMVRLRRGWNRVRASCASISRRAAIEPTLVLDKKHWPGTLAVERVLIQKACREASLADLKRTMLSVGAESGDKEWRAGAKYAYAVKMCGRTMVEFREEGQATAYVAGWMAHKTWSKAVWTEKGE